MESLLANPAVANIPSALVQYAQAQNAANLTGQQAEGAQIQNQLANLGMQKKQYIYGTAGFLGSAQPQNQLQTMPSPDQSAPSSNQLQGLSAPAGASLNQTPQQTESYPGQVAVEKFNMLPMPAPMAAMAYGADDQAKAIATAYENRRQTLYSLFDVPPAQYPQAVTQAFNAGYLTPQAYQNALAHPESQQLALQNLATPEAHMNYVATLSGQGLEPNQQTGQTEPSAAAAAAAGGLSGAKAQAAGQFDTTTIKVPDPAHPGQMIDQQVLKSGLPAAFGGAGAPASTAADMANPDLTISPAAYVARNTQTENPGGNPAARNPGEGQTASGNGQFTDQTWQDTVAKANPSWAQGLNAQQILALKNDPAKMGQMQYALAQQNAPALAAAGQPVNTLTLGLAHQFGADGAAAILKSSPNTPISSVVGPNVMSVNPQLAGKTVGQVMGQAYATYGQNKIDLTANPETIGAPSSTLPGAIPGAVSMTPLGQAQLGVTTDAIKSDAGTAAGAITAAQDSQKAQTQLLQMRSLVPQINTGSYADARNEMGNYLATFAPDVAKNFVDTLTAGKIDPSKAGATQEFVKLALQQAGTAERQTLGARGGLGAIQLYQKSFPNIAMQPSAMTDMSNLLLIAHQRDIDYGTGANQYYLDQRNSFQTNGKYQPIQQFDQQFTNSNPPQVYVGAAAALNGHPAAEWTKGLTTPQIAQAIGIVRRADPTATGIQGPRGPMVWSNSQ